MQILWHFQGLMCGACRLLRRIRTAPFGCLLSFSMSLRGILETFAKQILVLFLQIGREIKRILN